MKSHPLFIAALVAVVSTTMIGCRKPVSGAVIESVEPRVDSGRIVFPENSPQLAVIAVSPVKPCGDCRLHLNGRLAWNDDLTVRVFSPFAGRITRVAVSAGARVEKDAALALVASPDFGQAQSDARKAATDLALAERNAARLRELHVHGASAAKDVAAAEADLARAQSDASRTRARLATYGVTETDTIDNAYMLKSPVGGVVVERNLNAGQEVRPDQMLAGVERLAAPLFVVTDPTRLWLLMDMTEADAGQISVGQRLEVRVPSHPGRTFQAVVSYEGDALDPVTRMVRVRAVVENPDRELKAEQLVGVDVPTSGSAQSLDVPAAAVFLKGEQHFVFFEMAVGTFTRRQVEIGAAHQGNLQVMAGLGSGDRVVTDGAMLLEQLLEGAPSEAVPAAAEPESKKVKGSL